MVTDRLFRFAARKYALSDVSLPCSSRKKGGANLRVSSPFPGRSTLITSAPRSPSIWVQKGPARTLVKSRTLTPCKAPVTSAITNLNLFAWEYPRSAVDARRFLNGAEADEQGRGCLPEQSRGLSFRCRFRFEIPKDELVARGADVSIVRAKEFPAGSNVQSSRVERRAVVARQGGGAFDEDTCCLACAWHHVRSGPRRRAGDGRNGHLESRPQGWKRGAAQQLNRDGTSGSHLRHRNAQPDVDSNLFGPEWTGRRRAFPRAW